jgi:hypothetical protein
MLLRYQRIQRGNYVQTFAGNPAGLEGRRERCCPSV